MKFRSSFLLSHDIDWFCRIDNIPIHGASFGGNIPVRANDEKRMVDILLNIYKLSENQEGDIYINENYLTSIGIEKDERDDYLSSFLFFAKRGFYSYDRVVTHEDGMLDLDNKTEYALVAAPMNNGIDKDIFSILPFYPKIDNWVKQKIPKQLFSIERQNCNMLPRNR